MTQYARGRRFEWALAKQLRDDGAIVIRSAGSHGEADLVAFYRWGTVAIQAKTRNPTSAERAKVIAASQLSCATWALVWRNKSGIWWETYVDGQQEGAWTQPLKSEGGTGRKIATTKGCSASR